MTRREQRHEQIPPWDWMGLDFYRVRHPPTGTQVQEHAVNNEAPPLIKLNLVTTFSLFYCHFIVAQLLQLFFTNIY